MSKNYFSFKDGRAFAKVVFTRFKKSKHYKNKKTKTKILFISEKKDEDAQSDMIFSNDVGYANYYNVDCVRKCIMTNTFPPQELEPLYKAVVRSTKKERQRSFICEDCKLYPVPNLTARECIYVAGPSGSGKSTYAYNYALNYKLTHPDNDIFLFSRVDEDVFDDIEDIKRLKMDMSLVENQVSAQSFKDCLVIFDDTDTIFDKKVRDYINKIKNDILEIGRHNNIYCVITSHLLTKYGETRTIMNECHVITVFPHGGGVDQIRYCLMKYFGLSKKEVSELLRLDSRWVSVMKTYPKVIFYENGAYFL